VIDRFGIPQAINSEPQKAYQTGAMLTAKTERVKSFRLAR
jgi:hypothetical protein